MDRLQRIPALPVEVAIPHGVSSTELGVRLVAMLTDVYGAVVTDVTYTADGLPTYSVRLSAGRAQEVSAASFPSPP